MVRMIDNEGNKHTNFWVDGGSDKFKIDQCFTFTDSAHGFFSYYADPGFPNKDLGGGLGPEPI